MNQNELSVKGKVSVKKSWLALLTALAVFVLGICVAYSVDTQGGTVSVQDVYYTSSFDGSLLHGRLYVPKTATAKTPAPALVFFNGNDGDADKYSMIAVELSRRGYVAFMCDMRGQGLSGGLPGRNGSLDTYGAVEATEFLRAISFVDTKNLFIGGHSMGGFCACWAVGLHPEYYKGMLCMGIGISNISASLPANSKINVFLLTARDDPDAKSQASVAKYFGCSLSEFVSGKVYGSYEKGNARVNYQAMDAVHNSEYLSQPALAAAINYMQGAAKASNPIDGSSQVWVLRYVATALAYFALVFMVLPLGNILLNTAFFGSICRELPAYKGNTKARWWIFAVITAVFAPVMYFFWTAAPSSWIPTNIFIVQRATLTMNWSLLVAFVTIGVLIAGFILTRKKNRPALSSYGITYEKGTRLVSIAKSLLLSLIILLALYSLLSVTYKWTLIDVRIWNASFKVLSDVRVGRVLIYFIPFAFAYFVLAANLHGTLRPKSGNVSILKEILINIVMIAPWYLIWAIWFGPFDWLKSSGALPAFKGMMYAFFWSVPLTMSIIATVSTYFFRKTGRIYLGAFINAWLVSWFLLGGFSMILNVKPF